MGNSICRSKEKKFGRRQSTFNRFVVVTALPTLFVLSGCAVGPAYKRPTMDVPAAFDTAPGDWKQANPREVSVDEEWWKAFGDAELSELQKTLRQSNFSLQASEAQYRQAKVAADAAPLAFFPTLSLSASSKSSKSAPLSGSTPTPSSTTSSLSLSSSWVVDVWGGVRSEYKVVKGNQQVAKATLAQALLVLQVSLAQYYVQLRVADVQIQKLQTLKEMYQRMLDLTQSRYKAGVVAVTDVEQVRAEVLSAEVQFRDAQIQRAQLEHAIAILLGKAPETWHLAARSTLDLNLPKVPGVLPSSLLERRPDIAVAERQVYVANANVGVATAAYFPSLNLNGSYGGIQEGWGKWFSLPNPVWSFGPSIAWSILDSGQLYVQKEQAKAAYDESVAHYRQTVLSAFQEVEDNLTALHVLEKESDTVQLEMQSTQRQVLGVTQQQAAGTISALDGMSLRIALVNQALSDNTLQGKRLLTTVTMIEALGGGWKGL